MAGSLLSMSNAEIERKVLSNEQLKQRFPFIKQVAAAKKKVDGCSSCQKGKFGAKYTQSLDELRRRIASMNTTDQAEFKRILGVDQIRFHQTVWEDGVNKRVAIRF